MAVVVRDLDHLCALAGAEIGVSDWMEITQEQITAFANVTGDRQWIHVDPARARAESPFGTTVAHGFLTLSLLSALAAPVRVPGVRMTINYGLDRVRFPSPVPAGSRIRARFRLAATEPSGEAVRATWNVTVELEGSPKPCCVADWILLYFPVPA